MRIDRKLALFASMPRLDALRDKWTWHYAKRDLDGLAVSVRTCASSFMVSIEAIWDRERRTSALILHGSKLTLSDISPHSVLKTLL